MFWNDLKNTVVEFWEGHKIGGTFIGLVVLLILANWAIDFFKWIF